MVSLGGFLSVAFKKNWLVDDAVHHTRFLTGFVLIIYEVFSHCVLCVMLSLPHLFSVFL